MPIFQDSNSKPKIKTAELQDRLDSHKSGMEEQQLHANLKQAYKQIIAGINENIQDSREKSQALTQLEDSFMWLGKAIFLPDRSEKTAQDGDSGEAERFPQYDHWLFEGTNNDSRLIIWLGEAFDGYTSRNVPGEVQDEIILNLKRVNGQGYEGPVKKGDVIHRRGKTYREGFAVDFTIG